MGKTRLTKREAETILKNQIKGLRFRRRDRREKDRQKHSNTLKQEKGRVYVPSAPRMGISGVSAPPTGQRSTNRVIKQLNSAKPLHQSWQSVVTPWSSISSKYNLQDSRYVEFKYLQYLDINNIFVDNYVQYQLGYKDPIIYNRLRYHLDFWKTLNSPPWLLDIIENGFKIDFHTPPPKMFFPNSKSCYDGNNFEWLTNTITEFLDYHFISEMNEIPYCVLPLQIAQHPEKLSLIHDESPLNFYVNKKNFKLEGWEYIFSYARNASYGIKFDIKKFYFHIDIHDNFKKYFGFSLYYKGKIRYFQFNVLPYGYSLAPYIARHLLKPLILKWRLLDILIVIYYDDGISIGQCKQFLEMASLQILCDLLRAGLVPGISKCIWLPCTKIDWVGYTWDFKKGTFHVKDRRITEFSFLLSDILKVWPKITYRNVSKIVGIINSMAPVFNGSEQIKSRYLQSLINIRYTRNYKWDDNILTRNIDLIRTAYDELLFWLKNVNFLNIRMFKPPIPTREGWVDASNSAQGGLILEWKRDRFVKALSIDSISHITYNYTDKNDIYNFMTTVQENLFRKGTVKNIKIFYEKFTSSQQAKDSNERELLSAYNLLYSTRHFLKNQMLTLHLDNQCAVSTILKGNTKLRLHEYALKINRLCSEYNIILNVVQIPRYINNVADRFSKCFDNEDYSVTPLFFCEIQEIFNLTCNIDRFANNFNKKIEFFNSAYCCPGSAGVDSFKFHWGLPYINYLFPPPRLILGTINHLLNCNGLGLLITPEWENSSYLPYLRFLCKKFKTCKMLRFKPDHVFQSGTDPTSYFGPNFNSAVIVWYLNFT